MIHLLDRIKRELASWLVVYAVMVGNPRLVDAALYDHKKRKKNINKYPVCVYSRHDGITQKKYYTREEAKEIMAEMLIKKRCAWISERTQEKQWEAYPER